jgi:multiple sugar transport system substrate-binding protein
VAFATVALCWILVVPWSASGASTAAFPWRQFEGTTLRVLLSQSHWQQVSASYFPEFEQLTGIRLAVEVYPQTQLWDILETGLREPGRVDVFMTVPALDGRRYLRAGGVQLANDYLRDPVLTAPDFRWEDFLPRARAAMEIDGALLGPPLMAEHLALMYRKDLFKEHKLSVPKNLDALAAAAHLLHKTPMANGGGRGVGIVARGNGTFATSIYAGILHALGGTWLDEARRPTVSRPESVAALELLGHLLGQHGPPNVTEFGWQEASALFLEGKAAMYIEGSSVYPIVERSAASRVRGKVGYAVFPGGPGGPGTTFAVRGLAIGRQSANPRAAWVFLQWAVSQKMVQRALIKGVLVGRESTWKDRSLYDGEIPDDLVHSFLEAGRIGTPDWAPPMVAVTAAREAVGKAITAAIRGEDVRAAADAAARRLREILLTTEGQEPGSTRTGS